MPKEMFNNDLLIKYIINKTLIQKLEIRKEFFYLQMNVTNRCTENCNHCYLKENHYISNESNADDLIHMVKQVKKKAEMFSKKLVVDLIGGDPLSKPDIFILLQYLNHEKIDYGIKGNPYLLFENMDTLVKLNCNRYQMSLDGLENTHDLLRSKNSYKSTINAIQLLNKNNIPVYIKYTLSDKNSNDLWPLLYELYGQNLKILFFSVARYFEENGTGFHVTKDYYEDAFEKLNTYYKMQIENKDVRININLKEHLWIPFLAQKKYLFREFFELVQDNPYLSSCSMILNNSITTTSDGYYHVCPKISNFEKIKNIDTYFEEKEKYISTIKDNSCLGCIWKKYCMGCLAFHTKCMNSRDRDCFLFMTDAE